MTTTPVVRWRLAGLLAASQLACGPTSDESNEDRAWLILDVSTFDEETKAGVLQLQARGGQAVELNLDGGSIRDELGTASGSLCALIRDDVVRRLPFTLDGDAATLTAVLLRASGEASAIESAEEGTCQGVDPIPVQTACCILPGDCGCDGETEGDDGESTGGTGTGSGGTAGTTVTGDETGTGTGAIGTETVTGTETQGSSDSGETGGTTGTEGTDTGTGDTTGASR